MNTLVNSSVTARHENGYIIIQMAGGVEIKFPISLNRRLAGGTHEQLNNIEVSPLGLHWPDLDEDLSLKGLADGDYGQYAGTPTCRCNRRTVVSS